MPQFLPPEDIGGVIYPIRVILEVGDVGMSSNSDGASFRRDHHKKLEDKVMLTWCCLIGEKKKKIGLKG